MDTWTWVSGSDYLCHYGTPMHSGRYPWGSGERPRQRLEGTANDPRRLKLTSEEKKLIRKALTSDYDGSNSSLSSSERKALTRALSKRDTYRQAVKDAKAQRKQERTQRKQERAEAKRAKKIQAEEEAKRVRTEAAEREAETARKQKETERATAIANGDRTEILKLFNELSNTELRTAMERINFKEQLSRVPQDQIKKGKGLVESALPKLKTASELISTVYTIKTGLDKFSKSDDSKVYKQVTGLLSKLQNSNDLSSLDLSKLDFNDGKFASKVKETNNMLKNLSEIQKMIQAPKTKSSDGGGKKGNKGKGK